MMDILYLLTAPILLCILQALSFVSGLEGECEVDVCDVNDPGFLCDTGSVIMIHTVMCRTRGRNCDMVAYREVTRLCSGRQYCLSADMWLISGKYCERNDRRAFLSIAIVSYMCVSAHAVESNCSQRGFRVSRDQRYLSSPGYPALVTGNSMCSWKLYPPHGYKVDIYVREYLHRDDTGQQYLRIKELAKNGQSLQLDSTAKRELTSTLSGEVELLLVTDGSTKGHRMWVEYRYVPEESLEHLRPFPVPNKTECGSVLLNKTSFPGLRPPAWIWIINHSNILPYSFQTLINTNNII
ncbi:uncharacterized protein LOC135477065 [Liolophura sinensis]|uniref:uncharacterized protein LOC135477065 n=1 Tax=Liolophura sinensis TaxID=3198878 RepID=UPI0031584BB2